MNFPLVKFVTNYLGLTYGKLVDQIEEEFDFSLSDENIESSFKATEGSYAEFGNKLFSDYEYFLKIKLNEDYGDKGFCEDKFIGTYDGEYSEFTYNGRPFKTRKQFEKILAQSQNQN